MVVFDGLGHGDRGIRNLAKNTGHHNYQLRVEESEAEEVTEVEVDDEGEVLVKTAPVPQFFKINT